jgi:hypothetical protein
MTTALDVTRIWGGGDPNVSTIDPGLEKYAIGWTAEIPSFQFLNFLQYRTDVNFRALAERGVTEWGTDIDYKLNSLTWNEFDSQVYVSVVAVPNQTRPDLNPSQWKPSALTLTQLEFTTLKNTIDNHIATITGNPHRVTASQAQTYTASELDVLLAQNQATLDAHINDLADPHQVTALQIGAVPKVGGTYTGLVGHTSRTRYGTNAYLDSSDGFLMEFNGFTLGINNAGEPVANGDVILHETNYLENKELTEPLYAVPVPDFFMPLVVDTSIQRGAGVSEFNGGGGLSYTGKDGATKSTVLDVPPFTKGGLWRGSNASHLIIQAEDNLEFPTRTLSIDITWDEHTSSAYNMLRSDNNVRFLGSSGSLSVADGVASNVFIASQASLTVGVVQKIAVVFTPTSTKTYLNGVLVASGNALAVPSGDIDIFSHSDIPNLSVRNSRSWATELTPQQIATL